MEGVLLDGEERLDAVFFEPGNHSAIGQIFSQLTCVVAVEGGLVLASGPLLFASVGPLGDCLVEVWGMPSFRHCNKYARRAKMTPIYYACIAVYK